MENIINSIINIEEQAQKIIAEADTLESNFYADAQKSIDSLNSDIENAVQTKYNTIKKNEADFANKRIEELKEKYINSQKALEHLYQEKKSEWIESIYNSIIDI